MSDTIKQILIHFVLPVLVPVIVGLGSAVITSMVVTERLSARVAHLEVQIEKHEKALDRDFARHEQTVAAISLKTDDHEKRLTRLEALFTENQAMLSEIRTDVKILLRGGQQ